MMYSATETNRYANIAAHAGPAPLGAWLIANLRRLISSPAKTQEARDRIREASEVRAWAASIQRTDPRFAADLFAAVDRHEALGS